MSDRSFRKGPLSLSLAAVAAVAIWFSVPAGRHLTMRFLGSLRMDKPQSVSVNLSEFVGPDANHSLQEMVTQMISDKVTVTENEKSQDASTSAEASQLAGFPVGLVRGRGNVSSIVVSGAHAYNMTVDRARLQTILDEAGRRDLVVPPAVDGAAVTVRIPRAVVVRYGTCPGRSSVAANVATPPPATTHYDDCLILREGPGPQVGAPADINLSQLSEIGLELAGMTPDQAHRFLKTVDWKTMLGVSFPRFMRSYQTVSVNGVPGTLLTLGTRRGPDYALIWVKNGIVYSLRGFGDPGEATKVAASVA